VTILVIIGSKIMKKIISILSIAIFFGCLLFRCNSDLKQDAPTPIAVSVTPEKLGQDADFIQLIDVANSIAKTVENNVYSLRTFPAVKENKQRIDALLNDGKAETEEELKEILSRLGFKNQDAFIQQMKSVDVLKRKLKNHYVNFDEIVGDSRKFNFALKGADFQLSLRNNLKVEDDGGYGVCVTCPLNNCDLCPNFNNPPNTTAPIAPGDQPPGSNARCKECVQGLEMQRQGRLNIARNWLIGELIVCGATGIRTGVWVGGAATAIGGPFGTPVGIFVGGVIGLGCVIWVTDTYYNTLLEIDGQYQSSLLGCGAPC
jgi:hypothetical protein